MKRLIWIVLFFILACDNENAPPCIKKTGTQQIESFWLPSYSEVEIDDYFEVYLHNSTQHKIEIEAGRNIIGDVAWTVKNNLITLSSNEKCSWSRNHERKINIHLYAPYFQKIVVRHPSKVFTTDTIVADILGFYIQTSLAEIDIKVKCRFFDYWNSHTNTGMYKISGFASECNLGNFGYATLDARNLIAKQCQLTSQSTGNTHANAIDSLTLNLKFVGDVYVHQKPKLFILNDLKKGGKVFFINK